MVRAIHVVVWLLAAAPACTQAVRVGGLREALVMQRAAPEVEPGASDPSEPTSFPPGSASAAPLYLEVWARAHGSVMAPLEPGMRLRAGDRIGVTARTSCAAQVLLLHCDRDAQLSVFPAQGTLALPAARRVQLPAAGMELPVGSTEGQEHLYVLASRAPLAEADPGLSAALAADPPPACGPDLERLLRGGEQTAPTRTRAALRGIDVSNAHYGVARAFAEDDGVVVLGFAFVGGAQNATPGPSL